ncbi:MAG TPA: hypothetical protein VGR28_07080 [Candidatus Thermoplasmatota archaeon]|nr:hypothetical protein [Candidatus Thermoplasmatota archaeon]
MARVVATMFFAEGTHANLRRVASRPMGKGVVLMVYEPAAEDAPKA